MVDFLVEDAQQHGVSRLWHAHRDAFLERSASTRDEVWIAATHRLILCG